jgi:hypothetical protein
LNADSELKALKAQQRLNQRLFLVTMRAMFAIPSAVARWLMVGASTRAPAGFFRADHDPPEVSLGYLFIVVSSIALAAF